MSGKMKGFALDSKARTEEAKARSRHQSLMEDFEDLQKEADAVRSRLDAAKQRKLVLTAEVRFLRKRRRCLVEANAAKSAQEQPSRAEERMGDGAEEASSVCLAQINSPPQPALKEGESERKSVDSNQELASSTRPPFILFGQKMVPRSPALPTRPPFFLSGKKL